MYVKYVYSAPGHIVHATEFICSICMCVHVPYIHINYMASIYNLGDHIASGTCIAIRCEIDVEVGCVLEHIYNNVGSMWPCCIRAV